MRLLHFFVALALAAPGCYLAHDVEPGVEPTPCTGSEPPRCVARPSPCEPATVAIAECVGDRWACPGGAVLHSSSWVEDVCLPLTGELDLFVDGVHEAPVPVPIEGECRWLVPLATDTGATYVPARSARACGEIELLSRASVVVVPEPSSFVGLSASFVDPRGDARVLVRGWRFDPLAPFGVRDLGVGFARVEGSDVVAPSEWLFDPTLDLGDAAVLFEGHVYAYGCPGIPDWIVEDCIVGRARVEALDDPEAWDVLGEAGWGEGPPRRVFGSGPHRGPVFRDPRGRGFVHIYAAGFGSTLEVTRAPRPEGPWSSPTTLAPCELPVDDEDAYCAGPVAYLDLWDPFEPGRIVLGYSIGTTADDGDARRRAAPDAYWPRLVRVPF